MATLSQKGAKQSRDSPESAVIESLRFDQSNPEDGVREWLVRKVHECLFDLGFKRTIFKDRILRTDHHGK